MKPQPVCFYCQQQFRDMQSLFRHRKGRGYGRFCARPGARH